MICDHKTISASIRWLQFIISTHNNSFSFKFKLQKRKNCKNEKREICKKKISNVTFEKFSVFSLLLRFFLMKTTHTILLFTMSHEFLIKREDLLLHFAHISPITICKTNYITTNKQRSRERGKKKLHLLSHKDSTYILICIHKHTCERGGWCWKLQKISNFLNCNWIFLSGNLCWKYFWWNYYLSEQSARRILRKIPLFSCVNPIHPVYHLFTYDYIMHIIFMAIPSIIFKYLILYCINCYLLETIFVCHLVFAMKILCKILQVNVIKINLKMKKRCTSENVVDDVNVRMKKKCRGGGWREGGVIKGGKMMAIMRIQFK